MIWRFGLILLASPALATPQFADLSATLPEHIYAGGWEHFVGGGVAVFDCNGDALPEVLAAGGTNPMLFLLNSGGMAFTPAPFPTITDSTGAYPLDMDGDDILDLYILRAGADRVLRGGLDCSFEDVTDAWNLPQEDRWTTAFTAWWEGERPTLAIGHYVDRSNPTGPFQACDSNTLLIPQAQTWRAEPLDPGFCALSMLAARDARDRPTLRISNDRHYYVRGGYEQMYDIAGHRFLTPEDGWQHVSLWGMGIASRDLTGDGRDEVMLTSMGDQLLQIAQPDGTYAAAPYSIGTYATLPHDGSDGRPSTGWHAQFGDVDNDGLSDLFIAKGNVDQMPTNAIHDPNDLLMQSPDGTFHQHATEAGIATRERARGAALVDLDRDGRLDLIVVNRRAPLELYRNTTADTGHWLAVDLRQPGGNTRAIGARVTVTTDSGSQSQQVTVGGGHAGGQSVPLHFGLGPATTAQIRVDWPDGTTTQTDATTNQSLTLTR
ncbi:CRTAC1 family protein [Pararhodobacter zhoushanensis]|uniref:CRTAC1 family protein n=1 Tax=Pararhodobacter zhoushanensis TaxID=2479545 RepID=A0ABT3GXK1_9RHOB|nr:CRTAC1 family protein [Pararhodobacter zhoushanensis]MCW1932233.1 CRTAC1 family protein [Pararhodobacter zhoushanensis]